MDTDSKCRHAEAELIDRRRSASASRYGLLTHMQIPSGLTNTQTTYFFTTDAILPPKKTL